MILSYSKNPTSKASHEDTTLFSVLKEELTCINRTQAINVARLKLMSLFICTLCKVQTVNYERLALGFDTKIEKNSNLRRIQRFFASYILDPDRIAKLVSMVFIAFIWCYKVGIYIDVFIKPIKIKKHGYRAKSLFK